MRRLVDKSAVANFADLVDAVAELIAAVLDMNDRLGVAAIGPVDIGDPSGWRTRWPSVER
jgi:hypothetical protein